MDYSLKSNKSRNGFALHPLVSLHQAKDPYAKESVVQLIRLVGIESLLLCATGKAEENVSAHRMPHCVLRKTPKTPIYCKASAGKI